MILDTEGNIRNKILNAIMDDPEIVMIIKEKYVDEEIWKFCIEREPSLFKKMKHPSEAICMFACEVDGANLKYIKNKFNYVTITPGMVYVAVRSNPKAILSVPKKFLNDSLKEMAFDRDPSLMEYFDDIREEYVERIIESKPYAIQYIPHPSESFVCEQIEKNPNICVYINNMTDKMMETLERFHPNYFSLYKNSRQSA